MTDKQYRCQNGDLIEVGEEYVWECDGYSLRVIGFDKGGIICRYDGDDEYYHYDEGDFISLWQEPKEEIDPRDKEIEELKAKLAKYEGEKEEAERQGYYTRRERLQLDFDGWIKHTTGKQPVANDVMVELIDIHGVFQRAERADYWRLWDTGDITHYRIVEDKR